MNPKQNTKRANSGLIDLLLWSASHQGMPTVSIMLPRLVCLKEKEVDAALSQFYVLKVATSSSYHTADNDSSLEDDRT